MIEKHEGLGAGRQTFAELALSMILRKNRGSVDRFYPWLMIFSILTATCLTNCIYWCCKGKLEVDHFLYRQKDVDVFLDNTRNKFVGFQLRGWVLKPNFLWQVWFVRLSLAAKLRRCSLVSSRNLSWRLRDEPFPPLQVLSDVILAHLQTNTYQQWTCRV